jgi:hypothetical protein
MPVRRRVALLGALLVVAACSPQKIALNRMASALANASSVYESDNDPEFVRLAAPSTLKTIEMLLSQNPNHAQLLLTACSGFTEYSYAFLHVESQLRAADPAVAQDLGARAAKMYARARGYCLRGLQLRHPRLTLPALTADPSGALAVVSKEDVPWLYWTAASWGAELALAPAQLRRLPELASVRALLNRAKALDGGWDRGAIYEAAIALDALPAVLGGSQASARDDFQKALALSDGKSVFAYVAYASTVSDPQEKRRLLQQAAAIDVSTLKGRRVTNLIAQRYARALLAAGH